MRSLTSKQKTLIQKYLNCYYREYEQNGYTLDGLTIYNQLEQLNDYETLWSDADRYANDYYNKLIFCKLVR